MTDWAKYPLEVMARGHVLNDEEVRLMCARIAELEAQQDADMRDLIKTEVVTRIQSQARADALRDALKPIRGWLATFSGVEIKHTSARDYATDAMRDVEDAILALIDKEPKP